jgi:hypothetical protein
VPRCQRGWAMAAAGSTAMARKVITATSFRKMISPGRRTPNCRKMLAQLRERRNRECGGPAVGSGPAPRGRRAPTTLGRDAEEEPDQPAGTVGNRRRRRLPRPASGPPGPR